MICCCLVEANQYQRAGLTQCNTIIIMYAYLSQSSFDPLICRLWFHDLISTWDHSDEYLLPHCCTRTKIHQHHWKIPGWSVLTIIMAVHSYDRLRRYLRINSNIPCYPKGGALTLTPVRGHSSAILSPKNTIQTLS